MGNNKKKMAGLGASLANKVISGINWEANGFSSIVYETLVNIGRILLYSVGVGYLISLNSLRRLSL